jgi:hypothetical protein
VFPEEGEVVADFLQQRSRDWLVLVEFVESGHPLLQVVAG